MTIWPESTRVVIASTAGMRAGTDDATLAARAGHRRLGPGRWSSDGRALLAALANEFGGIPYAVDPQTGAVRTHRQLPLPRLA
jgi:hypothetical protein